MPTPIDLKIERWKEELLDLSKGNPLLRLNHSRSAKLVLNYPDSNNLFDNIVSEGLELKLPIVKKRRRKKKNDDALPPDGALGDDLSELEELYIEDKDADIKFEYKDVRYLKTRLRKIYDNSRTSVEERGVTTLYLALGIAVWDDGFYEEAVSPLILVPCELIYKGAENPMKIKMADDEVSINPTLEYLFKKKHHINLPELPNEFSQKTITEYCKKCRAVLEGLGWSVKEEAWLGTFNFESLVILQDLEQLRGKAQENPIIKALAGITEKSKESLSDNSSEWDGLDDKSIPSEVPLTTLKADSSQLEAIARASSGQSLVIHGPPGTGKSQTIANIIATALGNNKKVLFVSAKIAALNVVYDRIRRMGVGLERLCLEAHGAKAGKAKIVEDLRKCLDELAFTPPPSSLEDKIEELVNTRVELNKYLSELHLNRTPLNVSAFQAIGYYSKINDSVPEIEFSLPWDKEILEVTEKELKTCVDALSELSEFGEVFENRASHPWRGFKAEVTTKLQREDIEKNLRLLIEKMSEIAQLSEKLKKILPGVEDMSLSQLLQLANALDAVSRVSKLPKGWWHYNVDELASHEAVFKRAIELSNDYRESLKGLKEYTNLIPTEVKQLLQPIMIDFNNWPRRITPKYLKWKRSLREKFEKNKKLNADILTKLFNTSDRLCIIKDWFEDNQKSLLISVARDDFFNTGLLEDCRMEFFAAGELKKISEELELLIGHSSVLTSEITCAAASLFSFIKFHFTPIIDSAKKLDSLFEGGFVDGKEIFQSIPSRIRTRAEEVLQNPNHFQEWTRLKISINNCNDLNLGDYLDIQLVKKIQTGHLVDVFSKRFWSLWISEAMDHSPFLRKFTVAGRLSLRTKLNNLESELTSLERRRIVSEASSGVNRVQTAQTGFAGGEVGILRKDLERRRIRPLRKLFKDIPTVLQALKPCMLMSPISVSTYLNSDDFKFDVIIFDEASQIPTAEAIPSILRGQQVIVAGDQKQLPPSRFWETSISDDDGDEDGQDLGSLESLLDECVAIRPVLQEAPLRWHYRSRDERLIKFSNNEFYDNKLITFPSPFVDMEGRGVKLEYVENGVWDRGKSRTNRLEARRVAKLVKDHLQKYPERSIGVVAFNASHKEAIEDAINEELSSAPDLRALFYGEKEEKSFVKSLENVQGDERDAIIISVGYAKGPDGVLRYNFGPLNTAGGWRRLNVLVTRAKWQVILVTSMRSSELHGVSRDNKGATSLKRYVEFAENGGQIREDATTAMTGEETNDFEDSICEAIKSNGYMAEPQVGVGKYRIDIGVKDPKNPDKYLLGIECDGATYHSSRTARDRDIIREEILNDMGWKLYRVWSTDWFNDRDGALKRMLDHIASVVRGRDKTAKKTVREEEVISKPAPIKVEDKFCEAVKVSVSAENSLDENAVQYRRFSKSYSSDIILKEKYHHRLANILADLIKEEGPLHQDIFEERIREIFKVSRLGNNIRKNLKVTLDYARLNKIIDYKTPFYKTHGRKIDYYRVPGDNVKRQIGQIPPEEIENAILSLVENQLGMFVDQLPHAVAKIFQDNFLEAHESDIIRDVVDGLVQDGRLHLSGNRVCLA